jgi:hypothetical protein
VTVTSVMELLSEATLGGCSRRRSPPRATPLATWCCTLRSLRAGEPRTRTRAGVCRLPVAWAYLRPRGAPDALPSAPHCPTPPGRSKAVGSTSLPPTPDPGWPGWAALGVWYYVWRLGSCSWEKARKRKGGEMRQSPIECAGRVPSSNSVPCFTFPASRFSRQGSG